MLLCVQSFEEEKFLNTAAIPQMFPWCTSFCDVCRGYCRAIYQTYVPLSSTCLPLLRHLESLRVVNGVSALQAARCSSQRFAYTLPLLPQTGRCLLAHLGTQTHTATILSPSAETWHFLPAPQYFSRHGLPSETRGKISHPRRFKYSIAEYILWNMLHIECNLECGTISARTFPSAVCYENARLMAGSYMRESGISWAANTRPFTIKLPIILGNAAILSSCDKSFRATVRSASAEYYCKCRVIIESLSPTILFLRFRNYDSFILAHSR